MVSVTNLPPVSLDGMVANVRQLCPHERIEFFEKLFRDCNFMEIRFIASLVENILSANYGCLSTVEDELPLLLSNSEKLMAFGDKLHIDDQRRQLIIILCLLKSRERLEVTKIIAELFQKVPEAVRKMSSTSSLTVLAAHEILLLFSLAMCHPAFEFSQKYNIYTALQSVVELLQPALGDGDKESCILLKSSFNKLAGQSSAVTGQEKPDVTKPIKISQDDDIAFIQVDIPVSSSNGTSAQQSLTVKTEKLVNVYAEKCVQQPNNPKTDPNTVLLKSKDGNRESVLHSALNAIVSDGGLSTLLEIFPQHEKGEETRKRTVVSKQESVDMGTTSSPDSELISNENQSPDNLSTQCLASCSSRSLDKNSTKSDLSRNTNGGPALSTETDGRKLAPSAPPSFNTDDSPSSATSSNEWFSGPSLSTKLSQNQSKSDDAGSVTSSDGATVSKSNQSGTSHIGFDASGDHAVSRPVRMPPLELPPNFPPLHADPKTVAVAMQCALLGVPPPPPLAGHFMWPGPHMMDPIAHRAPSPFIVPYSLPQQQPQLEESSANNNNTSHRALLGNSNRTSQSAPVQSSTPTPNASKQDNTPASTAASETTEKASSCDSAEEPSTSVSNASVVSSTSPETDSTTTVTDSKLQKDANVQHQEGTNSTALIEKDTKTTLSGNITPAVPSVPASTATATTTTVTTTQQSSVSSRPTAPMVHQQMPTHQLQLASNGPLGMPVPFSAPLQFIPYNQAHQVPQPAGAGSRRGSVASESGDPSHFPAYYVSYPPLVTAPNAPGNLAHSAATSSSSSSSFTGPRTNPSMTLPPFTNPPPPLPPIFHPSATNPTSSSRKTPVTVHSVSQAQLFSIPPPPMPGAQKSNASVIATTAGNTTASHPNVPPATHHILALTNRDIQHAIAGGLVNPQTDSFSPPSGRPSSPSNAGNTATVSAATTGGAAMPNLRQNSHHGPFSGQHAGMANNRRPSASLYANVHYHQRIGNQHSNGGHLHQSQSMGNMAAVRPQPTVVRGGTVNCFRCGEPGHLQNQCSNSNRRRTPFSGREFHINPIPPTSGPSDGQEVRLPFTHFVNQRTQSTSSQSQFSSTGEGNKPQPQSQQSSSNSAKSADNSEPVLPSVVVTSDSPTNPVAIAQ